MNTRVVVACFLLTTLPAAVVAAEPARKSRPKLYVTNSAGNDVTVIDVATLKPITTIEVGPHPHGIAVTDKQDVIYVSIEEKQGEIVAIDPVTDKVVRRIKVGPLPNQLAVTPDGKLAYVPCRAEGNWEVLDLAEGKIIKRIPIGGSPHNTVCSPDGKLMYLGPLGDVKKITIVEVAKHEPIGEIAFSNVIRPIALSKDGKRFYAQVDGLVGFEVADTTSRKMIHRIEANLTEEQKKAGSRSHGLAIRPDQKEIWDCDVVNGLVHVYDITGDKPRQTTSIPLGNRVYWLTFSPDGKTCYVAVRGSDEVAVVDAESKKVLQSIKVGKQPKRLIVVTPPG